MKSFPQLLKSAWSIVFRDQKTFWTLFLLTNGVGIITGGIFYILWYNMSNQADMQRMMAEVTPYVVFMLTTTIVWGFFWFIWMLYLANIFTTKKVRLWSVLSQWKRIFSYIWTLFCVFLYYAGIWISAVIAFGIAFWIAYLWYISAASLSHELALVVYATVGIIAFLIVVGVIWFVIWIFTSVFTFFVPAFFLDNAKYFDAPLASKKIISGRWWDTVWKVFLGSLTIAIVPIILTIIQQFFYTSGGVYLIATVASWLAGLLLTAFMFSLYIDYREHPIAQVKKTPKLTSKSSK